MDMLRRTITTLCIATALAAHAEERSAAPDPSATLAGPALVSALRRGGYTLYFRHTATDFSQNDAQMTSFQDCATQRNLSEAGRRDARAIGVAIRALRLPVGEVLASPYCRTMETARLMLDRASATRAVLGERREAKPDYSGLEKLLATDPGHGKVRVIAGHGNPFRAVAGPPHLAEGEAAVLAPRESGWIVVARIRVEAWPALVAAAP